LDLVADDQGRDAVRHTLKDEVEQFTDSLETCVQGFSLYSMAC
jgi:hypothetical protein